MGLGIQDPLTILVHRITKDLRFAHQDPWLHSELIGKVDGCIHGIPFGVVALEVVEPFVRRRDDDDTLGAVGDLHERWIRGGWCGQISGLKEHVTAAPDTATTRGKTACASDSTERSRTRNA